MSRITSLQHCLSVALISLVLVLAALAEPLAALASGGDPSGM
jgi:hypothetical protein